MNVVSIRQPLAFYGDDSHLLDVHAGRLTQKSWLKGTSREVVYAAGVFVSLEPIILIDFHVHTLSIITYPVQCGAMLDKSICSVHQ